MKVQFLKPYRNYKAGEVVDLSGEVLFSVIHRKAAKIYRETKEEKKLYENKSEI